MQNEGDADADSVVVVQCSSVQCRLSKCHEHHEKRVQLVGHVSTIKLNIGCIAVNLICFLNFAVFLVKVLGNAGKQY
mgnify:CR=1 FL=1